MISLSAQASIKTDYSKYIKQHPMIQFTISSIKSLNWNLKQLDKSLIY